jgi:hypothetical protein
MTLSSCKTTEHVNQRYPIIPLPNRPTISAELNKDDFKSLVKYATKLEIGIKEYNEHAKEENKKIEEHFKNR